MFSTQFYCVFTLNSNLFIMHRMQKNVAVRNSSATAHSNRIDSLWIRQTELHCVYCIPIFLSTMHLSVGSFKHAFNYHMDQCFSWSSSIFLIFYCVLDFFFRIDNNYNLSFCVYKRMRNEKKNENPDKMLSRLTFNEWLFMAFIFSKGV